MQVPSKFAVAAAPVAAAASGGAPTAAAKEEEKKSLLKSLMMTWVLVYLTKPWVIGVYFLMVYFRNVLFFGEFLSLILQNISSSLRIINLDVILQFVFLWMCLVGFIFECFLSL